MKLEVFPYRFRGKASAPALHSRGGGCLEVSTAKELFELYNAGVSFRAMPGTSFNAVVFDLDEVSPDYAPRIDALNLPGVFVTKSPSAILGIPGKVFRRKVFFQLSAPCKFETYASAYAAAFAKFIQDADLPLLECDRCMRSPRQMTFGRPFPDMARTIEKVRIPNLEKCRAPLPLSRYMAKAIFGIDAGTHLPPMEFYSYGPVPEGERHSYIWRKIIPTAFSWMRFFETTAETRWGLNQAGYVFEDCIEAIRSAMLRIGVAVPEIEAVIRGELESAYQGFTPPALTYYRPRGSAEENGQEASRWSRRTPEEKAAIYARQRANRRLKAFLHGRATSGRPRKYEINSLDDLERLYDTGELSKSYYFKLKKELGATPKKRGRPTQNSAPKIKRR